MVCIGLSNIDTLPKYVSFPEGAFTAMTNEESDEENDALPKMSKVNYEHL